MTQFVVRKLEPGVKALLKERAAVHGMSMEEEVRQILRNAVSRTARVPCKLGSKLGGRFKGLGLAAELPELRDQVLTPAEF